ncbi:thiamine phosphate synthase [Rhodothermus bifroesti]|uniref:thiamine phosphate synthase n=1 Tax=Rhodothermus bifroesti TaxID=2823335 RepID=UPI001AEF5425|nr:thiamine phosphate synthase [Rhodothermus bifroesti]
MNVSLPRLLLIADRFTDPKRADRVAQAVAAGVAWVQLRDHSVDVFTFARVAKELVGRLRALRPEVLVTVNTHVALAQQLGLGVHVGLRGPSVAEARRQVGSQLLLGYSAHDVASAQQAASEGADYVVFSPVFATRSKPERPPAGLEALKAVCQNVCIPVVALGGITPERVSDCLQQGAYGVAVVSAILEAPDPKQAVRAFLDACKSLDHTLCNPKHDPFPL